MIKKILILAGGFSKEREISLKTAGAVSKVLKKNNYITKIIEPDGNFITNLKKFKPSVVFNALHGRYGEDGYIQTILEKEKIKYTHSGVISSSLAIDKVLSKKLFIQNNILTPKYLLLNFKNKINKNELIKRINNKLGFPVVIKPINEGSSVGVFICNKKNLFKKIFYLRDNKEIIIERYIPGKEIQAAIMGNKKLGAIELKPKRKFYDYKAKYDANAKTEHIMPAEISKANYLKVMNISLKAHKLLKCKGTTRSDFRFYKNKFYLLELNTQPGMTSLSLVPEIAKFNNISFFNLIKWMISDASIRR
tara:strand:- start:60 stop:980 length:921 start_codon:yes stop_codon:yes gene_type:complete